MENVNQCKSLGLRGLSIVSTIKDTVLLNPTGAMRRAKETSCAPECAMMQATCHPICGKVPVTAPLNFFDCLTKLTSKAWTFSRVSWRHETARLAWGGAAGAHGSEGRESRSGGRSTLICLNSQNYKKIKSNGESSGDDCKQGSHAIPQRMVLGQKRWDQSRLFKRFCLLGEFFQACHWSKIICIELRS